MDCLPNTPKKLTIKCEPFRVCVVCCADIVSEHGCKGRRLLSTFEGTLKVLDCEYINIVDSLTKLNSNRKLFICRLCVKDIIKFADLSEKCKSITSTISTITSTITAKAAIFKKQFLQL